MGVVIFCVTLTEAVPVQPLAVSVVVTVYIDGLETVLAAVAGPLLQMKVVPTAGFEVAVNT